MSGALPAGWYPDPEGRAASRWWDGLWWTAWESDGAQLWVGTPPGPARYLDAQDVPALTFVRTTLLPEARRRQVLAGPQVDALARLTDQLAAEVLGPQAAPRVVPTPSDPQAPPAPPPARAPHAPAVPEPSPGAHAPPAQPAHEPAGAPGPAIAHFPTTTSAQASAPTQAAAPVQAPAPRPESRLGRWWRTSRLRLDTDLTVHGLTYLGVLLLFVGVFGLVAFAFGDVEPGMRPIAEIAVAAVPFAAARLLARSGARFVARAMIAVGGLILPVMLVTSLVDGYHLPPDPRGYALPTVAGLACGAVAAAYAVRVWRRPGSALGAMVAPAAWFAAGIGAVALGRPVPRGEDVAVPGAAQVMVIALAVLTTTWLARRVGEHRVPDTGPADTAATDVAAAPAARDPRSALATGALAAAPAGAVVTAVLALVAWAAEGWPLVPVLVTTAALALVVRHVLPTRAGDVLVAAWLVIAARVLTIGETTPVLTEHVVLPGASASARPALLLALVLAGVGLLELLLRNVRVSATSFAVLAWAVVPVALLGALGRGSAWWGVAGAVSLTVWAPVRRVSPPPLPRARGALDMVAVVAPIIVVGGVWQHLGGPAAGLLVAALAVAVTPLARGRLRRGPADRLWPRWWAGAVTATVVGSVMLAADGLLTGPAAGRVVVPAMLVLVIAALVTGPGSRVRDVALVTPVVWWLWAAVVEAFGWGPGALAPGYAALGLGAVVTAHLAYRATSGPSSPRAALAGAGHLTGVVAALAFTGARPLAAVVGVATLAWLVTAVLGDRGRSPLGAQLDGAGALRSLPWAVVLAGLPATAVLALHAGDVVRIGEPWWSAPLVVAALAYAAVTRARVPERLAPALPGAGYALAWLAVLAALVERGPSAGPPGWSIVVALAALVLVAPVVRARPPAFVWTAWLTLAPLAGTAAWAASGGLRDLGGETATFGALIGVGGLLAVGALLVDQARPRTPRVVPWFSPAVPPFLVGVGQLTLGAVGAAALPGLVPRVTDLGRTVPEPHVASGVLLLAVAVAVGAIAGLGGIGAVGALGALIAWAGARVLLADAYAGAWADVAVAGALLLVAFAASVVRPPEAWFTRWDVPLAVAATLPAVVALAGAGPSERSAVHVVVGGLAIGAAVRLGRRRATSETLATVGSVLVLLGAAWASPGWAAAALAGLAAAHTALAALRESGTWRTVRQWVGAALAAAAWLVFLSGPTALGGSDQVRVDTTAVAAALVTVGVIGVAAAGRLDRSWCAPWGTVAALLAVGALLAPAQGRDWVTASAWQVVAWTLLALAAALAGQLVGTRAGTQAQAWRTGWRVTAVAPVLGALLAGLAAASATALVRVSVLTLVSLLTAVVVVVAVRAGRRGLQTPLITLGAATLALAAGSVLAADGMTGPGGRDVPQSVLLAMVLAVAAVQAGGYGGALRVLGLRLAAPVLAWLAWAGYAVDALDGVAAWHTVPVGLAMIAVVGVWRADRRSRGLAAAEPGGAALEVAGIAFLVVASFVSAFTQSVWHALVAAGIGVLVFFWAILTRVRRRLVAGAVIVLAGVVIAAMLPLVALVPAWGGAALWVTVAVVGLLVVLAATFLERGRAAVLGGRERLRAATADWE